MPTISREEALKLLKSGIEGIEKWNQFRSQEGSVIPSLNGSILSGADLYGADLAQGNLNQANLRGANLSEATLTHGGDTGSRFHDASRYYTFTDLA